MSTTTRFARFLAACGAVLVLCGLVAAAAAARTTPATTPGDPLDPRTYAPESKLFLAVHALGVQKYACQADGTWLFTDPVAILFTDPADTLYKATGARKPKPVGVHFLNVATGRPVWQYKDGSSVEAARMVSVPAAAGNIPSLLLKAVVTTAGPDGNRMVGTTWVQRLDTVGGVAPAGTCTPGAKTAVLYSAEYSFWR
jgi:hypothetical protein